MCTGYLRYKSLGDSVKKFKKAVSSLVLIEELPLDLGAYRFATDNDNYPFLMSNEDYLSMENDDDGHTNFSLIPPPIT
jgi:hypothetical protein